MPQVNQQYEYRQAKRHARKDRPGFTLVMTLLLLAVAISLTASLARQSLVRSTESIEATRELQRRWAMRSIYQSLLPNAERLLVRDQEQSSKAVASIDFRLQLAGQEYHLRLSDEQAKLNLNRVFDLQGLRSCQQIVEELTTLDGEYAVQMLTTTRRSRPDGQTDKQAMQSDTSVERAFISLAQTITDDAPLAIQSISVNISCWGDGTVNIHRASAEVLAQACQPWLKFDEAKKIVDRRHELPGMGAAELISELQLTFGQQQQLATLLTDQTMCHSLWLTAMDDHRSWHFFVVHEKTADAKNYQQHVFTW